MKAANDRQQLRIGELEVESRGQEGTIVRQRSDIDGLKTAQTKCQEDLTRSIEANDAATRELAELREEIKAMKVKQDPLVEEVRKLKEEIRQMDSKTWKPFPPSVKKGTRGFDVPDGIIAYLTRECGGNVHDHNVIEVMSGSFETETQGANPHSGAYGNTPDNAAKNAADMEADSHFCSAYRNPSEDIPHTRNNWVCYDFKGRRIVPTHYAIRTCPGGAGGSHLKSWLVETSTDGKSWREVAREENNMELNGRKFTKTFAVAGGGECRFIRLVNIGRNQYGQSAIYISAWEIFGSLVE
jgi:hypothetical protein